MTYRVEASSALGRWGLAIVREGADMVVVDNHVRRGNEVVAVVVNGDQALAERICDLLNGDDDYWALVEETRPKPPTQPDDSPEAQAARAELLGLSRLADLARGRCKPHGIRWCGTCPRHGAVS